MRKVSTVDNSLASALVCSAAVTKAKEESLPYLLSLARASGHPPQSVCFLVALLHFVHPRLYQLSLLNLTLVFLSSKVIVTRTKTLHYSGLVAHFHLEPALPTWGKKAPLYTAVFAKAGEAQTCMHLC